MGSIKIRAIMVGILLILFLGIGILTPLPAITFYAPEKIVNKNTIAGLRGILETARVAVTWDEKKHTITLKDGTNSFYVAISTDAVEGVPIYVDSEFIGRSPVKIRLFPGKYRVTARPQGYVATLRYLTLMPGKEAGKANVERIVLPVEDHDYRDFLDEIIRNGYTTMRVMDYYLKSPVTKKTIVLRHDVDRSAAYALTMAKIEHQKGITSSCYFRWCTADAEVIKEIRSMGFEVGLHYETLATYSKKNKLESVRDITPEVQKELRNQQKSEIAEFRQKCGAIDTIASHGDEENTRLGITNYKGIMDRQDPREFGIIGCAYGPIITDLTYMTDAGGVWDPFPYPRFANNEGPFYILIHPVHWISNIQ